jgi:hypothetical protein
MEALMGRGVDDLQLIHHPLGRRHGDRHGSTRASQLGIALVSVLPVLLVVAFALGAY